MLNKQSHLNQSIHNHKFIGYHAGELTPAFYCLKESIMSVFTIEERNADAEQLKKDIGIGIALMRLKNMKEFQALIKEYTETHALSLIKQKASLVKQGVDSDNLQQQIDATALLTLFLDTIETKYESAKVSLNELNDEE